MKPAGFGIWIYLGLLLLWATACQRLSDSPAPPAPTSATPAAAARWFEDVTETLGVHFVHNTGNIGNYLVPEQMGSGAALFDFDNDGRLDLYLIQNAGRSSASRNQLFHQEADGRFRNVSEGSGLDVAGPGMGAAAGDVNNDGWTDLVLTEYGAVRLFLNEAGTGRFREITSAAGIDNPRWATSAAFLDYDRDGWLDLVIANYLDYDPSQKCTDAKGAPEFCGPHGFPGLSARLFHNLGRNAPATNNSGLPIARFQDVTVASKLAAVPGPALGVVCADFDGDRWPDIFFADDGKPNRLFINQRDGTFAEEAAQRGLALNSLGQTAGNMGIALGDMDGDALFDVFVTHLSEEQHVLWTQQPRGMFTDRTGTAGLANPNWRGTGFGAVLADFNRDGMLDLAFVNGLVKRRAGPGAPSAAVGTSPFWAPYAQRAQLFANHAHGGFHDISQVNAAFCGEATVGRGLAAGDLNNDGALDLVTTSVGGPARILRNVAPAAGHWLMVRAIDPQRGGRDAYGAEVIIEGAQRRWWGQVQAGGSYLCSSDPRVHFGLGANPGPVSVHIRWPEGELELFPDVNLDRHIVLRKGSGQKENP